MSMEKALTQKYGPLLSLCELAQLLKRSKDGLRIALNGNNEFAQTWNSARVKVGRRIYFRAADIAQIIDNSSGGEHNE
ncbi:DNA-binding protein [Alcaligenes faecalis]|uniref:DNA-binding protein n=2 Tax=Alcaligenes ammonioxydans TaxID=2582914 RepID=A0ABX8SPG2_9BURK|nr:DNA-binding protein [Alcaligenes ammonioxydans]